MIQETKVRTGINDEAFLLLQEAAAIGLWEVEIGRHDVYWSSGTKNIHEVPESFTPHVEGALAFYKEGLHRDKISKDFHLAVTEGIKFDGEYIVKTATGVEKWVRSVGVPVFENGICVKIYGVFQDIDDRKKADILLRQNEQRFRQTFENAPNGIALVTIDGSWLQVNSRAATILGFDRNELQGVNFKQITHPNDLENDTELANDLLAGSKENYQIEKRYIHKQGHIVWCIVSVSLVRTDEGIPSYFIAQILDITSVKETNDKVVQLLKETESQNERLLNFKHIVSHNLRSHTSNLDMLLNFLKDDVPVVNDYEVFGLVNDAFSNLKETIVNLSEVSHFENRDLDDYEQVNLVSELNKTFLNISALADDVGAKIKMNIDSNIKVMVIKEYLRSTFLNLITNAIKYRNEDKKLLIEIDHERVQNYDILSFKDNGLGIDLELHGKRLFGMYKTFHRLEDSRGLGLFIVKNQLEAMGGKIEVESKLGEGSTFKVFLKNETN